MTNRTETLESAGSISRSVNPTRSVTLSGFREKAEVINESSAYKALYRF